MNPLLRFGVVDSIKVKVKWSLRALYGHVWE